jgi:ATP/maltotriose-dependent transcriptional regulator MalT
MLDCFATQDLNGGAANMSAVAKTPSSTHRTQAVGRLTSEAGDLLSKREREVLRLIGFGLTNKEVAKRLGVAPETIKSHIKHIFRKLAVERRTHAVSKGHSLGLIEAPAG